MEVHGTNTFASLVLATLNINLPLSIHFSLSRIDTILTLFHSSNKFTQRSQFMHASLRELVITEKDGASLIGILSLLARGGAECQARKNMAYNTLLLRLESLASSSSSQSQSQSQSSNNKNNEEKQPQLDGPLKIVFEFLLSYLEDHKYKALKMAFLEPTRLYFDCVGDHGTMLLLLFVVCLLLLLCTLLPNLLFRMLSMHLIQITPSEFVPLN